MTRGIEINDVTVGMGAEATKEKTVLANVRMFLHHGTEVTYPTPRGPKMKIDLTRRKCIAGLRAGIVGMRVGGVRSILISPHLAYGESGIPGRIPPNALLRCEVELLEVRHRNVRTPEDSPPGKHLQVTYGGDAVRGQPWWQFFIHEDGRCGASFKIPIPEVHWRRLPRKGVEIPLPADEAAILIQNALDLPGLSPSECLPFDRLWSDRDERGTPITRDRQGDSICVVVSLYEQGETIRYYALHLDSPAVSDSNLFSAINSLLKPHIVSAVTAESAKRQVRRLPN
jgi:hypothetical protein